jgi:hypothetical protein
VRLQHPQKKTARDWDGIFPKVSTLPPATIHRDMKIKTLNFDKRFRSAGKPKVPNKAANKSSRSRAKTEALHDRYSRAIATSMLNDKFSKQCRDRHESRKAYREAKRQARLAHPRYVLD